MVSNRIVTIDSNSLRDLYNSFIYRHDAAFWSNDENISDIEIIKQLITLYPNTERFEFLNLVKHARSRLYKAISEMRLPFEKHRVDNENAIIFLKMTTTSTNNIIRHGTNNLLLINNINSKNKKNNTNMDKKKLIADIIFDIKDTMTDNMFKELMETLNLISD